MARKSKHIRMTADEEKMIEAKAKMAQVSFSDFMVDSALVSKISVHTKYSDEQAQQIHHDITQLTSHVNALATILNHSLRSGGHLEWSIIEKDLHALLTEARKVATLYDDQKS